MCVLTAVLRLEVRGQSLGVACSLIIWAPGISWAEVVRLGSKYSSRWVILLAPILIFYFQTWYHVGMVVYTIISTSWKAEAGGWFWVKGSETTLGNIARLSWNKNKSRTERSGLFALKPHSALFSHRSPLFLTLAALWSS